MDPSKIFVAVCPTGRWPPCGVHLAKFLEKMDLGFRSERSGIGLPAPGTHREHRNGDSDSRACLRQTARLATSSRSTQTIPESFASWLTWWRHFHSAHLPYSSVFGRPRHIRSRIRLNIISAPSLCALDGRTLRLTAEHIRSSTVERDHLEAPCCARLHSTERRLLLVRLTGSTEVAARVDREHRSCWRRLTRSAEVAGEVDRPSSTSPIIHSSEMHPCHDPQQVSIGPPSTSYRSPGILQKTVIYVSSRGSSTDRV